MDRARRHRRGDLRQPLRGERARPRTRGSGFRAPAHRRLPRSPSAAPRRASSPRAGTPPPSPKSATLRRARPHHLRSAANESLTAMGFPQQTTATHAPVRCLAAHGARDSPDARRTHLSAVRRARRAVRHAVESMPGICQLSVDEAVKEAQRGRGQRRPGGAAVRRARRTKTRRRARRSTRRGSRRRPSPPSRRRVRAPGVGGRVPVRRDRPRSLRPRDGRGRDRQRLLH